jgi:hypothetical protein
MQRRLTDYGKRRESKPPTNCGPSPSLSTVKETHLKGFLSELLNNRNDNKHYCSSYLYNNFQICTPNRTVNGQLSFLSSHKNAIWYQTNTCICRKPTRNKNPAIISGQQAHLSDIRSVFIPGKERRQTDRQTDRQTIVCWIFMAVLCCQLLPFPQAGECRLKVNRCVGFCMYAGARHLLSVAWWRTAAPSSETRPILHCDHHLRENYDNELKMVKLEFTSLRKTNAYFFCINCIVAVLHFPRPTHDSFTVYTNLVPNLVMRILKRAKLQKLCFAMVTNCVQQS